MRAQIWLNQESSGCNQVIIVVVVDDELEDLSTFRNFRLRFIQSEYTYTQTRENIQTNVDGDHQCQRNSLIYKSAPVNRGPESLNQPEDLNWALNSLHRDRRTSGGSGESPEQTDRNMLLRKLKSRRHLRRPDCQLTIFYYPQVKDQGYLITHLPQPRHRKSEAPHPV